MASEEMVEELEEALEDLHADDVQQYGEKPAAGD